MKGILTRTLLFLCLFPAFVFPAEGAGEDASMPALSGGSVRLLGSTRPEIMIEADSSVRIPVLQSPGLLTRGNNLLLRGSLSVSPVGLNLRADAVLTPIAVLELHAGGGAGTGWDLTDDLQGARVWEGENRRSDSLGGIFYQSWAGLALQFDTGAVIPGEWTSILLRTYQEVNFQGYSGAGEDETWEFQLGGRREGGASYRGDYFIGYRMPILLDTVGLLFETLVHDFSGDSSSPLFLSLSGVMNFGISPAFSLAVIPQFTTRRVNEDTRAIEKVDFHFRRLAFILNFRW